MKHPYNDQEIQAAIDRALEKVDTNSGSLVSRFHYPNTFKSEAPARLALLKSVLDRLPEPQPSEAEYYLPKIPNPITQPAAVGLTEALVIANKSADDQMRLKREAVVRAEKAEAELAECHARLLDTTAGAAVVAERASRYAAELSKLRADNAELFQRLEERTQSHLHASARDVQTIQQQAVLLDRLAQLVDDASEKADDGDIFKTEWETQARAALAAYESAKSGSFTDPLAEAVKRMESVPWTELRTLCVSNEEQNDFETVRTRLIQAAKGVQP